MPDRLESCSLVSLFERVCPRYASHQHDTKYDDSSAPKLKKFRGRANALSSSP